MTSQSDHNEQQDINLTRGVQAGDADALRTLMTRHDRLVRLTVYRTLHHACRRDPELLDAVSSETWTGFVTAVTRRGVPSQSVRALLVTIARNKSADALRRLGRGVPIGTDELETVDVSATDPSEVLMDAERVDLLRACIAELPENDRNLFRHMHLFVEGRWREAGALLGLPESTIRSRWKAAIERLRAAMRKKIEEIGDDFAP